MSELKPRITENGIDYILVGDYYIPDLKLPEESRPIGKYGRLHREYLREAHPARLQALTLTGKLWTYLADLNEQAQERLDTIMEQLKGQELPMLKVTDFISDMGAAYKAADLVISRAGASSISEFCLIGKPVILVPSPNVAEDHQTKNAMALVNKDAAIYVKDADAPEVLLKKAVDTVKDEAKLDSLCENIKKLGLKNSADVIADEVIKLATK